MKQFIVAPTKSYGEIYQDSDLKFAFAVEDDKSIRQVHDFIKCRDFFNEALVASQVGCVSPTIYGFKYPSDKYPVDLKVTRMILNGGDFTLLLKNLKLLNDYEATIREEEPFEFTDLFEIPGTEHLYLCSSSRWVRSTVMISLYTHIIRCLYQYEHAAENFLDFMEKCANHTGNAAKYQKSINKIDMDMLIKYAKVVFPDGTLPHPGMSSIESVGNIHNYGGIVSWSESISSGRSNLQGMYADSVAIYRSL